MIITKDLIPQSRITMETFNYLKSIYQGEKISDIVSLISKSTGRKIDLDLKHVWSPLISSRLLDYQIDYSNGKEVDLSEMKEFLYSSLEFAKKDRLILDKDNLEDRLWAILLVISDPYRKNFIYD